MEGTVALKHGLVARGILEHATVRSPLLPLEPGAEIEIADALRSAGLLAATPRGATTRAAKHGGRIPLGRLEAERPIAPPQSKQGGESDALSSRAASSFCRHSPWRRLRS